MKKICLIFFLMLIINMSISVSALSISVNIPEKYSDVIAGERFYFEISIKYPENPIRKDLRLEYQILTENGILIAQAKALKAVETQASFIDFIIIPKITKSGLHMINVNIKDYEFLNEEVSSSFHIVKSDDNQITIYLIIILVAIILVALLVIISIIVHKK